MSGTSTPSRRLSSTTMRVAPPSRRKARSCNSAQMRELQRKVSRRTDLRLQPSVITNSRVRRYLRLSGSRTDGNAVTDSLRAAEALHAVGRWLEDLTPPAILSGGGSRPGPLFFPSGWLLGWAFPPPAAIRFGLALF